MPDRFHQVQYLIAAGLGLVFGVLYAFAPQARAEGLLTLATAAVGFCLGKFSNGFNRARRGGGNDE